MKKVLVTGGAGFIGSHLVRTLAAKGIKVTVLDNLSTGNRSNLRGALSSIKFLKGDIRDQKTLEQSARGVSHIFHLAAISSVLLSVDEPADTWDVNLRGTWNVLEAARVNRIDRVVFASSASVYGANLRTPFRESTPLKGSSPYATSKLLGEGLCDQYARLYGIKTTALRFFSVYGPRQNPKSQYSAVIPTFATRLLAGQRPTVYGNGTQTRDFIFVNDVVRAILLAARRRAAIGRVINVGTGKQVSVNQLLGAVQKGLNTYIDPVYAPLKPGDDPRTCADTRLARTLLGFNPKVTLDRGLQRTLEWFGHGHSTAGSRR